MKDIPHSRLGWECHGCLETSFLLKRFGSKDLQACGQGLAMHAIMQVKPMGPQVLDLNVPAPPAPSLDGHTLMALLEFPEEEFQGTPAARIQRKQEFRKIQDEVKLRDFFKPHVVTASNVNEPLGGPKRFTFGSIFCSSTERLWPLHMAAGDRILVFYEGGGLPVGVDAGLVYRFTPEPDAGTLQQLIQEGDQHAQQERTRRGLPAPVPVAQPVAALGGPAPAAGVNAGLPVPDLVPMAVDQGGLGQLMGAGLGDIVGGADGVAPADDARTLSITRDPEGNRFKDFRAAVQQSRPVEFKDWPDQGQLDMSFCR
eukprot:s336_g27.t1